MRAPSSDEQQWKYGGNGDYLPYLSGFAQVELGIGPIEVPQCVRNDKMDLPFGPENLHLIEGPRNLVEGGLL